jgi:hypothetical protein
MTHDPLCPNIKHPDGCLCCEISAPCIYCDLIAKVREDAIATSVQRVEALPPHHGSYAGWLMADEAIAAIKGDSDA